MPAYRTRNLELDAHNTSEEQADIFFELVSIRFSEVYLFCSIAVTLIVAYGEADSETVLIPRVNLRETSIPTRKRWARNFDNRVAFWASVCCHAVLIVWNILFHKTVQVID